LIAWRVQKSSSSLAISVFDVNPYLGSQSFGYVYLYTPAVKSIQ